MANRVKCTQCEVMILEVTAKYNNRMCAPCHSDHSSNKFNQIVQGWYNNPNTLPGTNGIPEPDDISLSMAASQIRRKLYPTEEDKVEDFCHDFFDKAHDKWFKFGPLLLTKREKYTLAVETFYGEVWNGGILQYLGNESGAFANWANKGFETIGLPEYSQLMKEVKSLFPKSKIPKNPDKRWDIVETLDEDVLETLTNRAFEICEHDEDIIRKKLYEYLKG